MSAFRRLVDGAAAPAGKAEPDKPTPARRVVTLEPSAFADTWALRPRKAVQVGLRVTGEAVAETARAEAAKLAWKRHPQHDDEENRVDCFNDALMRWAVAEGTCQPGDASKDLWFPAHDIVRIGLTAEAVKRLFHELDRLAIETSPVSPEATDEEIDLLADALKTGQAWTGMTRQDAIETRRLLKHCLDRMVAPMVFERMAQDAELADTG